MPRFEYRFDIGAILLASVLSAIGVTDAPAAGKGGHVGECCRGGRAVDENPACARSSATRESQFETAGCLHLAEVKGGHVSEVRSSTDGR